MALYRLKWLQGVDCFKLIELLHSCSKRLNIYFNWLNKLVDGESLDLYLKRVFKKIMFIKSLVFWKWNEEQKRNDMKFIFLKSAKLIEVINQPRSQRFLSL